MNAILVVKEINAGKKKRQKDWKDILYEECKDDPQTGIFDETTKERTMNNSMERMVKSWQSIAKSFPDMRYPNYNLNTHCSLTSETLPPSQKVSFRFESFVQNEGGTRICLVADTYHYFGQYKEFMLEESVKRFKDKCDLTKEKHIFSIRTSIREPFDFNK